MSLKTFRENPVFAVFVLYLYVFLMDKIPVSGMLICTFLWYLRTHDHTWIVLFAVLFLPFSFSKIRFHPGSTGKVIEVHEKYSIILSNHAKAVVYTDPLPFDAEVSLEGYGEPVPRQKSFFGFDFGSWLIRRGILYQFECDQIHVISEKNTVLRAIQKRIDSGYSNETAAFLNKVLLNISDRDMITGTLVDSSGFSLAGVLLCVDSMLSHFMDDQKRRKLLIAMNLLLIGVYGFRMSLVMRLLRQLTEHIRADSKEKNAWILSAIILIYRQETLSAGFLMPAVYRLFDKRSARYAAAATVQSVINNRVSPLQSVLFPYLMIAAGYFWFSGILILIFPSLGSLSVIRMLHSMTLITDSWYIRGSILGAGFPVFVFIAASFRKTEFGTWIYLAVLVLFLFCGVFHPFAEVAYINVGQGDSILIRGPFSSFNVLIDTGKPSALSRVDSALSARGVRRLDCLIITHQDSDHAGNKNEIADMYQPEQIIENHQERIKTGSLTLYDLNRIEDEDENGRPAGDIFGTAVSDERTEISDDGRCRSESRRRYHFQ